MRKYLAVALSIVMMSIVLTSNALAQELIPKVGDRCPNKYESSGDSCMPLAGAREAMPKIGSRCPSGFSVDGKYCYRPYKGTNKVIAKVGKQCPKGFWIDGAYCQSFK